MLLLALAASRALSFESPGQADLFAFVLWNGGVVAFHHLGNGGTTTGCEARQNLGVGKGVGLGDHAGLSARGGVGFLEVTDLLQRIDRGKSKLVPRSRHGREAVVLLVVHALDDPLEVGTLVWAGRSMTL